MRRLNWFTGILAVSIVVRLYLVFCTEGSFDIQLWETHAQNILDLGLSGYYASDIAKETVYNHPPVIGKIVSLVFLFCKTTGFPFKILFRLLLTSLDYVVAWHLYKMFEHSPHRLRLVAFYLMNPLTIIFSAYHGNTDTCVALAILMSLYFISRRNLVAAGIALGLGVWVKWIVLLALPVLFFALPELRQKARLVLSVAVAALAGYAWHLCSDPASLIHRVFGYKGQLIQTTGGLPIWGNRIIFNWLFGLDQNSDFIYHLLHYNQLAVALLVILYAWLKRNRTEPEGIGRTLAEALIIFYAVSNFWAFQYLVWVTPFLCFLTLPLMLTVTVICSAYIYALYSLVCESFLLLGTWDFIGHPLLSEPVLLLRDLSVISLLTMALFLMGDAFVQEQRLRSDRRFSRQLESKGTSL